jgi:hypothetical protein
MKLFRKIVSVPVYLIGVPIFTVGTLLIVLAASIKNGANITLSRMEGFQIKVKGDE